MDNSTISMFIEIFNILSTGIVAFFAIVGALTVIFTIYYKIANKQIPKSSFLSRKAFAAFCFCCTAAFLLEITFFNFQHYLKFFADKEFHTTQISEQNPEIILTTDSSVLAETIVWKNEEGRITASGVVFKNLDRRITSVFVKPNFKHTEFLQILIQWTDEESTRRFEKLLYKGLPHENHTIIQPCGKVSQLTIMFAGDGLDEIVQIAINKQVPYYFSGLRLLVVSFLIFALILFFNKKLRAKTSYYLFEYKFDPTNKKQNIIYALSIVLLIIFSWICAYTSGTNTEHPRLLQYNVHLVDAIIAGRTNLDYGNPEKLLSAERPYDTGYLSSNGYYWMLDWAWYKGKYYSYFGVVPAVILYVPYKLITGNYLSNQAGIFLFSSIAIILLAILWRFCVKKYMPNTRFAFYMLSFLTLFFASGLFAILRFTQFYGIVQAAGFMFVVAGILLLFKSVENEKTNLWKLFFACLCFALVVGCRPSLIFSSLLVPVVLWKYRSLKLFFFILIPYIMIAIPLCWYNYVRFDSIFDFGAKYNLTAGNLLTYYSANPLGIIARTFTSAMFYIFAFNEYSQFFPYVKLFFQENPVSMGIFKFGDVSGGFINFPIIFCLLYFSKIYSKQIRLQPNTFHKLLPTFLIIAAITLLFNSYYVGYSMRYLIDFSLFILFPTLFCAHHIANTQNELCQSNHTIKFIYILFAITILIGLFLFVEGYSFSYKNPTLYRYLEYSLGFIRSV